MSKEEIFNAKVTQQLQSDPKLRLYVEWAQKNGVIMEKVTFPSAFGSDQSYVVGSAAKQDIAHNEASLFIPNKLLITVERARSSAIGFIFDDHENVFKANEDRDFLTILVFMMYEHQKGEESFWYPYFQGVNPGELTCFWDEKYFQMLDDSELKEQIKAYRKSLEDEWTQVSKILDLYSPDYFNLEICNYNLFKHVACFIATRCFGWGLPTTLVVPIADSLNHSSKAQNMIDLVNKRLHLMKNKIYAYQFNFDQEGDGVDDQYDKSTSKLKYNIKAVFKAEDNLNAEQVALVSGEEQTKEEIDNHTANKYDEDEVYKRFQDLLRAETNNQDEFESEESKKEKFPQHGTELWGIGYVSSDNEQDDDQDDHEEDPEEGAYNEDIRRKIIDKKGDPDDFNMEEFETISSNTRLREIYSYRWWSDSDQDNYFVMINRQFQPLKKGSQLYYNYGRRTNAYLLENYGFTLDESNQYNSLEFRVILGVNPKDTVHSAADLMPSSKLLEDRDNIDTTTETIKVKPYRISESMFAYLRSVLQNNYNGADSEYLMVSSPRLLDYELLVIEFALDLLEYYGKHELLAHRTLEEDLKLYEHEREDYKLRFILQHNIQRKKIYHQHIKLLKVLKAMLESIQVSQESFSRATFRRVEGVEDQDSEYELFKRRMGMRNYFKELKMNMQRIKRSKQERSKPKEEKKKQPKPSTGSKDGNSPDKKDTISSIAKSSKGMKKKKK